MDKPATGTARASQTGESVCGNARQKLIFRLGFESSLESAQGIGAEEMVRVAAQQSEGRIDIQLFPGSRLGNGGEMIKMVRAGDKLDLFHGGAGLFVSLESRLNIFDIPYLFDSLEDAYTVLDGEFGREMLASMEPSGLKGMAFWENGIRSITNDSRPITSPEDLQGLKMRIMPDNAVYERIWKFFGCETTPMASSAVYEAIRNGIINSQEHPIAVIYARKFYEVQKYLSLTRHLYGPAIQVMNLEKFDALPLYQQDILMHASSAGATAMRKYSNDNEAEFLREMKAGGLQVNEVDVTLFKNRIRPVIEKEFVKKNGDTWLKRIEASIEISKKQ